MNIGLFGIKRNNNPVRQCSGNTKAFGAFIRGSSPRRTANLKEQMKQKTELTNDSFEKPAKYRETILLLPGNTEQQAYDKTCSNVEKEKDAIIRKLLLGSGATEEDLAGKDYVKNNVAAVPTNNEGDHMLFHLQKPIACFSKMERIGNVIQFQYMEIKKTLTKTKEQK